MKQLEKTHDPGVERQIYQRWQDQNYFHAKVDKARKPYTIMMPPPNITGVLHVGHALNNIIQDILIRFKRMQGFNVLWLPGTDHASISTEAKIVAKMAVEGVTKADIGREGFLERAWAWRDEFGGTIVEQLRLLGLSCDWRRERFTLDEGLSNAVLETFIRYYNKGLIYRGEKLINWCPHCKTTISDAEVEHEDKDGYMYYFKYPIESGGFIEFATTRPETMLGDTAIAVHPEDERYTHLVGQMAKIPVVDRQIPIIADIYVEKDFGTGVVKITPAHDPNDYEVGERHNLAKINIMADDGTINANGGKYAGLTREECRERIIEDFKTLGLFVKTQNIRHAVGAHDRCHTVMEPLIKLQWFVTMKDLARPALDAYINGKVRFTPARMGKVYAHWLENIRDWCISRQLWWGHRIPAYYCQECGHINVAITKPGQCSKCGCADLRQDEDVLDTWFSSALWPFSTLGWPEKTEELEYFYPTNTLVTASEIIFFWVVRMVFSGIELMGEAPFSDVIINGTVRDDLGRKMEKSLGNGVDPIKVIEQYGADALRLMMITGNALDSDTRFIWPRLEVARNFLNKIWNAARFVMMHMDVDVPTLDITPQKLTVADKWILSLLAKTCANVTERIEAFDLVMAAQITYDFLWDYFCDWYIEMVKPRLYNKEHDKDNDTRMSALWTLNTVLTAGLKLLHPFVPFITEEIYTTLHENEETIMFAPWPTFDYRFEEEEQLAARFIEAVKGIRNSRLQNGIAPSQKLNVALAADKTLSDFFAEQNKSFNMMAGVGTFSIVDASDAQPDISAKDTATTVVISGGVLHISLDAVDVEKEKKRLEKEKSKITNEIERCRSRLSNEGFISKAPENLIADERAKLAKYEEMLVKVNEQSARL
ncbi:MAG: valine--tRNA ligase [Clostridiales bacterium]|nr:valine--tRNA ligase [Clostridiales bacterium]